MACRPGSRKRIYPIHRAPDGSAFQKCGSCGTNVIYVLFDMHDGECRRKKESSGGNKRLKSSDQNAMPKSSEENSSIESSIISSQPRSPFRFFMEDFRRSYADSDWIQIDREGFQKWKNMSKEERQPYVVMADEVNSSYDRGLLDSVEEVVGTDSETVKNYYPDNEHEGFMDDSDCYLNFDTSGMTDTSGFDQLIC
ncbi:hypothetical protein H6P81_008123 [Aristolochia fimbriata]|uniref:HMG box domain-containing protein n=1 Tax=Aristolochia fimbriata TaxID=158543 RepID=A0AAV7F2T8_ARIFI|nr:hypothetical protein H6P81_008123 [Aristolochia fimbriata]